MKTLIPSFPVFHAGRKPVVHPRLGVEIVGQTAIAYLRFFQPVKLDRLELPLSLCGRWIPSVLTHPDHLVLSVFDRRGLRWKTIREVNLPHNPVIAGKGRLLYGADGPVKAWVNGEAAGCEPQATNPAVADQYDADVTWKEGMNEILFAIHTNRGGAWGVMARAVLD